jgi:CheY-like chemotaxis protein
VTASHLDRPLVAVIEDEPFMAQLVGDMLTSGGVDVEVFSLGSDFLKRQRHKNFKAFILDLSLPDIDGFEVMDKLADDFIGISIVLMTGHDLAVLRAAKIYGNGLGLKIRGTLTKPFSREQLFSALGLKA